MRRCLLGLAVGLIGYSILAGLHFPANAQNIEVTPNLVVCDTAEQSAMFGSLIDEAGIKAAMDRVNEDAKNPVACMPATVAYFISERGQVVKALGKEWNITKITVMGVVVNGRMQQVSPEDFYALVKSLDQPS